MLTSGTTRHSLITAHTATITMYYSRTQRVFLKENTLAVDVMQTTVQLQAKKNIPLVSIILQKPNLIRGAK